MTLTDGIDVMESAKQFKDSLRESLEAICQINDGAATLASLRRMRQAYRVKRTKDSAEGARERLRAIEAGGANPPVSSIPHLTEKDMASNEVKLAEQARVPLVGVGVNEGQPSGANMALVLTWAAEDGSWMNNLFVINMPAHYIDPAAMPLRIRAHILLRELKVLSQFNTIDWSDARGGFAQVGRIREKEDAWANSR